MRGRQFDSDAREVSLRKVERRFQGQRQRKECGRSGTVGPSMKRKGISFHRGFVSARQELGKRLRVQGPRPRVEGAGEGAVWTASSGSGWAPRNRLCETAEMKKGQQRGSRTQASNAQVPRRERTSALGWRLQEPCSGTQSELVRCRGGTAGFDLPTESGGPRVRCLQRAPSRGLASEREPSCT